MNHSLDELPAAVEKLAELRERAGRDPGDAVEVTLGGTPTNEADVERYTEAGVDRSARAAIRADLGSGRRIWPVRRTVHRD